jgi:hypothetical protein
MLINIDKAYEGTCWVTVNSCFDEILLNSLAAPPLTPPLPGRGTVVLCASLSLCILSEPQCNIFLKPTTFTKDKNDD